MAMGPRDFLRRVGFGLRPNQPLPSDPLGWAQAQMETVPDLIWPGRIYSEKEMLDIRVDFTTAEQKLEQTVKDPAKMKPMREALYNRSGRRFFEGYELAIRHYQAVHASTPVFERFWHFWGNHFAIVDKQKLPTFNTGAMQRDVIRERMTGSFTDLVYDVTLTWPMLRSLDNFISRGPNSSFNVNRKKRNKPAKGLNENHARELLELHTISPAGGYSQTDVINAAYVMTGWGFIGGKKGVESKQIGFSGGLHEPGTHEILGKKYKSKGFDAKTKGKNQLRELVEDLCGYEACRTFISWKLCQHFICDNPTDEMVRFVAEAWQKSGGMLPEIHQAVLAAAWKFGGAHSKFLSPETWLLQSARITGSTWPGPPEHFDYDFASKPTYRQKRAAVVLRELGHLPFRAKQPNGFPDTAADWVSPEFLVRRLSLINVPTRMGLIDRNADAATIVKTAIKKNFDNPEMLLKSQDALGENGSKAAYLVALLCSKRMLKA